ncbi:hypothetical protein R6Q57_005906, partial [Mikania cordata]
HPYISQKTCKSPSLIHFNGHDQSFRFLPCDDRHGPAVRGHGLSLRLIKWWKIFTPDQCSGINRFVALFVVPLLSFHFISTNNPYTMNLRFIAADTLQKLLVLAILAAWANLTKRGSLEWSITMFSLSSLWGSRCLKGCMVVNQFRGARLLISEQFPGTAVAIASIHVNSDAMSLDGRHVLETEAEIKEDGKIHVVVSKSNASRSDVFSRRSQGFSSITPRPSNMSNAEIYSMQSSRNPTPRGSSFNHNDFYPMAGGGGGRNSNFGASDVSGPPMSRGPTPRSSNYEGEGRMNKSMFHHVIGVMGGNYSTPNPRMFSPSTEKPNEPSTMKINGHKTDEGSNDLHMFVCLELECFPGLSCICRSTRPTNNKRFKSSRIGL